VNKFTIKTGTEDGFFERGRQLARIADRGEVLPEACIISLEDPDDAMELEAERDRLTHEALADADADADADAGRIIDQQTVRRWADSMVDDEVVRRSVSGSDSHNGTE